MPSNVSPQLVWNFDHSIGALAPDQVAPSVPLDPSIDETQFHANGNRSADGAEIVADGAFLDGDGKSLRLTANPGYGHNLIQPQIARNLILAIPPNHTSLFGAQTFDFRIKFGPVIPGSPDEGDIPPHESLTYRLNIYDGSSDSIFWYIEVTQKYIQIRTPGDFLELVAKTTFVEPLDPNEWHAVRFCAFNDGARTVHAFVDGQFVIAGYGGALGASSPDQIYMEHVATVDEPNTGWVQIDRLAIIRRGQYASYTPSSSVGTFVFDEVSIPRLEVAPNDLILGLNDGGAYFEDVAIVGGTPPYSVVVFSGQPPPGTYFGASGYLLGRAKALGRYDVVLKIVDAAGVEGFTNLSMVVVEDASEYDDDTGGGGGPLF